jgi:uncharacterized protein with GYD domain
VSSEKQAPAEKEATLETFIILGKYTQQGIEKIKEGPTRIEALRKAVTDAGGKMVAWYLTMGCYDFVLIAEASNVKGVASMLLETAAQGNVRTQTLLALTEADFKAVVSSLL